MYENILSWRLAGHGHDLYDIILQYNIFMTKMYKLFQNNVELQLLL